MNVLKIAIWVLFCTSASFVFERRSIAMDEFRLQALNQISQTLSVGSFQMHIRVFEDGAEVEADISARFKNDKLQFKRTFRSKLPGKPEFTNWFGPELVAIPGDGTVLSRVIEYEDSAIRQVRNSPSLDSNLQLFWPPFIGNSIGGVWSMPQQSPRGFLEIASYELINSSPVSLDGQRATRVEYKSPDRANMLVWFLTDCGGLVGKMEMQASTPQAKFLYTSKSELKEYSQGVWFPSQITTERFIDGNRVFHETVQVKSLSLTEPEDDVFGIKGVELEVGDVLYEEAKNNYFLLTKSGLNLMTEREVSDRFSKNLDKVMPPSKEKGVRFSVVWFLISANIACVGAYFLYKRRSKRK